MTFPQTTLSTYNIHNTNNVCYNTKKLLYLAPDVQLQEKTQSPTAYLGFFGECLFINSIIRFTYVITRYKRKELQ